MSSQYKKGALELCVLSLLGEKDRYGYDISESLSKYIEIADGTVYPILRNLKSDGLVTTYLSEDSGGPPRKYYSLTKTGREEFINQKEKWLSFAKAISEILEGREENE